MSIFQRIARTGINVTVLIISIVVFIVAFIALQGVANAQRPKTLDVLAASHDLNIGDVIGPADISIKTVYVDSNSDLYIPSTEQDSVVGGVAALPIGAGQPIYRNAIMAPAAEGTRFSAVLSKYPNDALFPLPLDRANVISPDAESFQPGDLVNIILVVGTRPKPIETPTPQPSYYYDQNNPNLAIPSPTPLPTPVGPQQTNDYKTYPPLAKSLVPNGVRVLAVQGLPTSNTVQPQDQTTSPAQFADYNKPKILVLIVPNDVIEPLSLALDQGDMVIVSLLSKGGPKTPGFTYWDFEELFQKDRQEILGNK